MRIYVVQDQWIKTDGDNDDYISGAEEFTNPRCSKSKNDLEGI
jgi:hypothetical protein